MTNSKFICFILTLALVASLEFCTCDRAPLDYLPTQEKPLIGREVNWIDKKINSGEWGQNINEVAENLGKAAQTAYELKTDESSIFQFDGKDIKNFIENTDDTKKYLLPATLTSFKRLSDNEVELFRQCTLADVRFLLDVIDLKFDGFKKMELTKLKPSFKGLTFDYLRHFAPKYYSRCLNRLDVGFDRTLELMDGENEKKLDALVLMGEQLSTPEPEADASLAAQAEKLDLVKGKFDASKMLKAVEEYLPKKEKHDWLKRDSAKLLTEFIEEACNHVNLSIAKHFDIYNIARFLVPEEAASKVKVTDKFRKFNEYSRICMPFKFAKQEVLSNIRNNMIRLGIKSTFGLN